MNGLPYFYSQSIAELHNRGNGNAYTALDNVSRLHMIRSAVYLIDNERCFKSASTVVKNVSGVHRPLLPALRDHVLVYISHIYIYIYIYVY